MKAAVSVGVDVANVTANCCTWNYSAHYVLLQDKCDWRCCSTV